MAKAMAITNTIAWSAFWAFGLLALSAPAEQGGQILQAALLASAGALLGTFTFLHLVRYSEATGYAAPRNRVV